MANRKLTIRTVDNQFYTFYSKDCDIEKNINLSTFEGFIKITYKSNKGSSKEARNYYFNARTIICWEEKEVDSYEYHSA